MSFQAYLDTIETRTGLTPRQFVDLASARGFGPDAKAAPILEWLAADYGLGRGHGMALVHVITKGDRISAKHVGTGGSHRDDSDRLWLDGQATTPHADRSRGSRQGRAPRSRAREHGAMTDANGPGSGLPDSSDTEEAVEQVVAEVRDDIRHGQVDEDVTHVLEERLDEAGVSLRPEKVDDLAEEIENDVSI